MTLTIRRFCAVLTTLGLASPQLALAAPTTATLRTQAGLESATEKPLAQTLFPARPAGLEKPGVGANIMTRVGGPPSLMVYGGANRLFINGLSAYDGEQLVRVVERRGKRWTINRDLQFQGLADYLVGMAYAASRQELFVTLPERGEVLVYTVREYGAPTRTISGFTNPSDMAFDDEQGMLFISEPWANRIVRVDPAAGTLTNFVSILKPGGLSIGGGRVYVSYFDDGWRIAGFDAQTGERQVVIGDAQSRFAPWIAYGRVGQTEVLFARVHPDAMHPDAVRAFDPSLTVRGRFQSLHAGSLVGEMPRAL